MAVHDDRKRPWHHLEEHFRAALGQSIYGEIQRRRFERAIELMSEPQRTLTEIAYESGFDDLHHLCRSFRARLGTTPGIFRQKLLAGVVGPGALNAAFE